MYGHPAGDTLVVVVVAEHEREQQTEKKRIRKSR